MAGGKETPRQKMIGMMYLVLTALLALNVSKQILDAFVAIEDNIQRGSVTQVERGDAARSTMEEEMKGLTKDADGLVKIAKIKKYLGMINEIDKEASNLIRFIDKIKIDLLTESKEDVTTVKDQDRDVIVWKRFDPKHPLHPMRLNLAAVQVKDQFDIPMHQLVGSDISKLDPKLNGKKLWDSYNKFRKFIVERTGTYKENESSSWKVVLSQDINDDLTNEELEKKIKKMINAKPNKVNPEDAEVLLGLYQELTKIEMAPHGEDASKKNAPKYHWMARTFDHAPMVGAIASLSSMQNEILSARAKAVNLLKGKVTVGEFSFNKIQELVSGPGVATEGEDIELKITMAAYDSDNNPEVTGPGTITVQNGIGTLKTKASGSGEMTLNGTVMIRTKSGLPKRRPWSWKVSIAKPQGSISLPELSVLYLGYPNKVVPVVAGMVSSSISIDKGTCTKSNFTVDGTAYNGYIVQPSGAGFAFITLTATDKDGKSKSFGRFKYKIKSLPAGTLQQTSISKSMGGPISVGLGDSPLTSLTFVVTGGKVIIGEQEINFSGARIPASALAKAKVGKTVSVVVNYKKNGTAAITPGVLKVTQ